MKVNGIRSASEFVKDIEKFVSDLDVTYMEAIMMYVDSNGIEVETVASMVKQNNILKTKLYAECESVNLVEKTNKLPM